MTETPKTRSVIVEREMAHPPARIWRALTQPHLIAEWLMKNDFQPVTGHKFQMSGDWGAVDCTVTEVEPERALAYTWTAFGLESTVTWTLTPTAGGTHLRMEQAGFQAGQGQFYSGAKASWPGFIANLESVVAKLD